MGVVPEIEVFRIEEVDFQIDLAMLASANSRRCDGEICGESWREVDCPFVFRRFDEPFWEVASDDGEGTAFAVGTILVFWGEHAVERSC